MSPAVVHVASGREWRGGQRQVWLLARELQRAGSPDQVVVTGAGTELAARLRSHDVRVHEARWQPGLDPRVLLPIVREVRAGAALLHAHDAHAVTLAGLVALITGVPLVATRRVDFRLRRPGLWRRAARVIAISSAVADVLIDDGVDPARIQVVHSGIDLESARQAEPLGLRGRLGLGTETRLACTVGALVPHKDHATLLHAARLLAGPFPTLHWVIAGEGELRPLLHWLAAELGVADRVHFLGHVSQPLGVIAAADVFVMSSREEGLGTSVLDAMARGIPVASTSAGGLPEMLHEDAGILVPPRSPDALARAVRRILCDPDLRQRLVEQATRRVQSFSAERMAAEVLTVYRSCAPSLDGP
ncbi:MAG TPA: glycosyltransferase [Gemmatimonadales bacterium]|nr:glycosyltransferase [Gemmatimonadales bacterium]